jgi:protein-disulfide isomerase
VSKKSRKNKPRDPREAPKSQPAASAPPPRTAAAPAARKGPGRGKLFGLVAVALLVAFVIGTLVYTSRTAQWAESVDGERLAQLAGQDPPTLGKPDAKVHIVEFFDPACETCAAFYPEVKKIMAAEPERIRLTMRHTPFHEGADQAVRILEAARLQGKYWQVLEALFKSQDQWTINHRVHGDRILPLIEGLGLDMARLRVDMHSPDIGRRIERDMADARALGVKKTPEYFVNGRGLPRFGLEELKTLVRDALRVSYP